MTSDKLHTVVDTYYQERAAWLHIANTHAGEIVKYLTKIDAISNDYIKEVQSDTEFLQNLSQRELDQYTAMEIEFLDTFQDKYSNFHELYDHLNKFWAHL